MSYRPWSNASRSFIVIGSLSYCPSSTHPSSRSYLTNHVAAMFTSLDYQAQACRSAPHMRTRFKRGKKRRVWGREPRHYCWKRRPFLTLIRSHRSKLEQPQPYPHRRLYSRRTRTCWSRVRSRIKVARAAYSYGKFHLQNLTLPSTRSLTQRRLWSTSSSSSSSPSK